MKKDFLKNTLIVVLTLGFALCLTHELGLWGSDTSTLDTKEECAQRTQIQGAYSKLLHRIWVDKPSYVEDVLVETNEFIELNSLVGDEGIKYVFSFWSEQDSIDYHSHWYGGMPDTMPIELKPDKKTKL